MATLITRIKVSDVTGLKSTEFQPHPGETVLVMVQELTRNLGLPDVDGRGQPIAYSARRESDGQSLAASEFVADVLNEHDNVFIEPDINAG
jgi:hypothetical protein